MMNEWISMNDATYAKDGNGLTVKALPKTDFFVNPENDEITCNAPFLYQEVTGDFVIQAKVSHAFTSTYDACVLFAYENDQTWAKACFEYTDLGTKSVVTVMTNGKSDDANGVNVDCNQIWLKLCRKGNLFAVHYSFDGEAFLMARLTYIPMGACIKVGLVAQSPLGDGGEMRFDCVQLRLETIHNIRMGV